jgi:hypothetical protein
METRYKPKAILDTLIKLDAPATAKETAAPLIEAWAHTYEEEANNQTVLAVEALGFLWLDKLTLLVGMMDKIAEIQNGTGSLIFGSEWKTMKEPKRNKDGQFSAWWNEDKWLEEISLGPQIGIYALMLHEGTFVLPGIYTNLYAKLYNGEPPKGSLSRTPGATLWTPKVPTKVHMQVRAVLKCDPPEFWPTKEEDGIIQFDEDRLNSVRSALLTKAAAIRAMRKTGLIPWQAPGKHCFSRYTGAKCEFLEPNCTQSKHPEGQGLLIEKPDPGFNALKFAGVNDLLDVDPRLVVFSASSYQTASNCLEDYRLKMSIPGSGEENINMQTGTCFHEGIATWYREYL